MDRFSARDGFPLASSTFGGPAPRRVIIAPATGVPRTYYERFAAWLAERGWPALTFDYRGIGDSRPEATLRGFEADMMDWAEKDLASAVDHARSELGAEHVVIVGHSFGGQAVGLLPNLEHVRGIVGVGAQLGDFRLWPRPDRYAFAAAMFALVPAFTELFGYLPGQLGVGEDLPRGVALQWARWCTQPGYYVAGRRAPRRERLARLSAPVRLYSIGDDRYAPPRAVDALGKLLVSASVERRHLDPRAFGGAIGHFGFFRPRFADSLWPDVLQFLEETLDPARFDERRRVARAGDAAALDQYMFDRRARSEAPLA
ncbi:MAG: alpha/beta fold hydrolase [Polyangiaceae bacterium]